MQTLRAMSRGTASIVAAAARPPRARATAPPRSRRAMSPRRMRATATNNEDDGNSNTRETWSSPADTPPDPTAAASASRALRLVDEAMDLLHCELFVSEAIARATGEEAEDERRVVARVVEALASGKEEAQQGFEGREEEDGDDVLELLGLSSSNQQSNQQKQQKQQKQPRQLDEAFLVALGIAAAAATSAPLPEGESEETEKDDGDDDDDAKAREIARRLLLLREATVARASASLPAELRALDAAARAASSQERRAVVREALVGGPCSSSSSSSSVPSPPPLQQRVSPAAFYSASCQVIDDMEERQIVPDASLLARVVLCRDDALALQRGGGGSNESGSSDKSSSSGSNSSKNHESAFADRPEEDADLRDAVSSHGAMLHRAGAELAGALVSEACKTSGDRRELLRQVMRRGEVLAWQGSEKDMSSIPTLAKAKASPRPGRLFAALYATRDALAARGDSRRAEALESARRDAVEVLEEIAYEGGPAKS